jgi:hypothetical protein
MAKRATVLVDLENPFVKYFTGLWETKIMLDSLQVYKGATVENWTAQSVSNRETASWLTTVEVKFPDMPKVTVKLAKGWCPARVVAGYNGELPGGKSKAEDTWGKYKAGDIKPINRPKEVAALMGYALDNLITGSIQSGENVIKVYMLDSAIAIFKPESLVITLLQDQVTLAKDLVTKEWLPVDGFKNQMVFDLESIKALLIACKPRIDLALSVPKARQVTTRKGSRPGMVDI